MRRVVKNSEVYHLWAHQVQDEARGYGSTSFRGKDAYSYGAVIGKIVEAPKGEQVFILDTHSYSVTTSIHQSYLWRAVPNDKPTFRADYRLTSYHFDAQDFLNSMLKELPEMALKAKRSRKYKEYYQVDIERRIAECREFARLFKLSTRNIPASTAIDTSIVEKIAAQEAARVKAENKRRLAENQERLEKWLAGEHVWGLSLPTAYLRIAPNDPETTETTMGARVPTEHIRAVKPLVLAYIRDGREYQRNGHTIHLGHYALDSIDAKGTVRAGCHTFTKAEILRFAELI